MENWLILNALWTINSPQSVCEVFFFLFLMIALHASYDN